MLPQRGYRVLIRRTAEHGISRGFVEYAVALEDRMTVLDALFHVQREQDPSLVFRCACRVGMCGTCAVSINGIPRLACKTRVSALSEDTVRIAPLPNLPVIQDLAVSLRPFFAQWKKVAPWFQPVNPESQELAVIPEDSQYRGTTEGKRDCITCGACYSACGVKSTSEEYIGPAALNRALLRILDPRDKAAGARLDIVNDERAGVWRCHTQFNCTAVCPKGITLTDSIVRLKRLMLRPRAIEKIGGPK